MPNGWETLKAHSIRLERENDALRAERDRLREATNVTMRVNASLGARVQALSAALTACDSLLTLVRHRFAGVTPIPDDLRQEIDTISSRARAALAAANERVEKLEKALREIEKGEGRYSRDPLEHASNTIEDMTALAREALRPAAPPEESQK